MDTSVASLRLRQRGVASFAAPAPTSTSGTGYPWADGAMLYAHDLNAAIAGAAVTGGALLTTGGTMTGRLVLSDGGNAISDRAVQVFGDSRYLQLATGGTLGGALTLAADPIAPLQPVTLQYLQANSTSGYPLMQAPQPAGGFMSSPYPFGTLNQATAFSTAIAPPDQYGRPIMPQVSGYHGPSDLANYVDRGYVTLYAGASSSGVTTVTVSSATYTATTVVLSPALTPTQLTFVQQAVAANNARAPLWPAAYASQNIGMQIDTMHSPKYTGCITGVAVDGSSITVSGWYQQGNTAAGQVPANGAGCYINPCTKMWNMNGVMALNAGDMCNQMCFLEIDSYNNQTAFNGATNPIPTIGVSANAHGNTGGYAYVGQGPWYVDYLAQTASYCGFLIRGTSGVGTGGIDTPFGFVSQVRSDISGGHHPFAYYDFALATPSYRFTVGSNGGLQLGAPAYDNGFNIIPGVPGTPPVIQAAGPDTNIALRLVPKGTGMVQTQSTGIALGGGGPTWTTGAGAPSGTQPVGSIYSNTSGAAGARLYVSAGGGTWTAIAGV